MHYSLTHIVCAPRVTVLAQLTKSVCVVVSVMLTNVTIPTDVQLKNDARVLASGRCRFVGGQHRRRPPRQRRWNGPALLAEI